VTWYEIQVSDIEHPHNTQKHSFFFFFFQETRFFDAYSSLFDLNLHILAFSRPVGPSQASFRTRFAPEMAPSTTPNPGLSAHSLAHNLSHLVKASQARTEEAQRIFYLVVTLWDTYL
jgi:hypothetical protein